MGKEYIIIAILFIISVNLVSAELSLNGEVCSSETDCSSGFCADGYCCDTTCTGTCEACNVAGSLGTCTNIPNRQDPAEECPLIRCGDYLYGWSGNKCMTYEGSKSGGYCNGAGACNNIASTCSGDMLFTYCQCDSGCMKSCPQGALKSNYDKPCYGGGNGLSICYYQYQPGQGSCASGQVCDWQGKCVFSETNPCGDTICNATLGETCSSCSADCGSCYVTPTTSPSGGSSGGGGGGSSGGGGSGTSSSGGGGGSATTGTSNANSYTITSEQITNGYTQELSVNGQIKFEFLTDNKTEQHSLIINNIGADFVELTIQSSPINLRLNISEEKKLNLTSSDYYDLYIKLESISNSKAKITIKQINEPIQTGFLKITGAVIGFAKTKNGVVSIIITIMCIIIIFLIIRSKKQKKKKEKNKTKF